MIPFLIDRITKSNFKHWPDFPPATTRQISLQLAQTIDTYAKLDRTKWEAEGLDNLHRLKDADIYIKKLRKNRQSIQAHLSEPKLNWAASVQVLVEIARRLDANYSYELEYQLLFNAEKILAELYGPDFVGIADLQLQRAVCLNNQDRVADIEAKQPGRSGKDGIYGSIKEIWEINTKKSLDLPLNSKLTAKQLGQEPDYIRALLKLGQWQRRMNRYKEAEENITSAMNAAKVYNKFESDELAEFYSSYANLLDQTNRKELSMKYRKLARIERQRSAKELGMDYIDHHMFDDDND